MAPELVQLVILYLMAVNLAAFFLMGVDKRRAVGKKWRISEKTLFLPAVLGGVAPVCPGGYPLGGGVHCFVWGPGLAAGGQITPRGPHRGVPPPLCSISDYSFFS